MTAKQFVSVRNDPAALEIAEQVVKIYTVNGATRWTEAFRGHPEWKEQLLASHAMQQLYTYANEEKRKRLRATGMAAKHNPIDELREKRRLKQQEYRAAHKAKKALKARRVPDSPIVMGKQEWQLHGCPSCLAVFSGLPDVDFCYKCGLPLKGVKEGIKIANEINHR